MENIKSQKLLNKIQRDLLRNGIITNTLVQDLKDLRVLVVEEDIPLLAKVIRLTFEHVEAYQGFEIAIPQDEPVSISSEEEQNDNEEIDGEATPADTDAKPEEIITGQESLDYLLSLMADSSNKINEIELREYVKSFRNYAEEN